MFNYCVCCDRKTWIEGELCSACQKSFSEVENSGVFISYATEEETELIELLNLER